MELKTEKDYSHCATCHGPCACVIACCETNWATEISEVITIFVGCAFIDWGLEIKWHENDNDFLKGWLKESLVSSGASAGYAILVSTLLRVMNYHCAKKFMDDRLDDRKKTYFYMATALSQLLSGLTSFGFGLLVDFMIEAFVTHEAIDKKINENVVTVIGASSIALTKAAGRFLFFKLVDQVQKKCLLEEDLSLGDSLSSLHDYGSSRGNNTGTQ